MQRVLRIRELTRTCGLCRSTIYDRMNADDFPSGFLVGGRRVWREAEISTWLEAEEKRGSRKGIGPSRGKKKPK